MFPCSPSASSGGCQAAAGSRRRLSEGASEAALHGSDRFIQSHSPLPAVFAFSAYVVTNGTEKALTLVWPENPKHCNSEL
jgi:hypothetical protein